MSDNFKGNIADIVKQEPVDYEEMALVDEAEENSLPDEPPLEEEQTDAAAPVAQDGADWSESSGSQDDVHDQNSIREARSGQSASASSIVYSQIYRPDGNPYSSQQRLHDRMRIQRNEKPFRCEICTKTFHSTANINEHRRTHSDERKEQCPFCEKNYKYRSSLTDHVKKKHPKNSKNIPINSRKTRRNDDRAGYSFQGDS